MLLLAALLLVVCHVALLQFGVRCRLLCAVGYWLVLCVVDGCCAVVVVGGCGVLCAAVNCVLPLADGCRCLVLSVSYQ